MNYGQFLNMIPEFYLVLTLLAVFVVDFIMHRSEKKLDVLFSVTAALLIVLPVRIALLAEPAEAFGGMYVASQAANVMKICWRVLSADTLYTAWYVCHDVQRLVPAVLPWTGDSFSTYGLLSGFRQV